MVYSTGQFAGSAQFIVFAAEVGCSFADNSSFNVAEVGSYTVVATHMIKG